MHTDVSHANLMPIVLLSHLHVNIQALLISLFLLFSLPLKNNTINPRLVASAA